MPSWQFHLLKTVFLLRRFFNPPSGEVNFDKERLDIEALGANFKTTIELTCAQVDVSGVPAEWISTPETSKEAVILYLHGGAYVIGSIKSHRSVVGNIANSAKTSALIIDYRLAPEYSFPAALEDTITAYRWLLESHFSPDRIVVAGDSAGGGLVLSLLISLRDANEPLPTVGVCLSPWTDLTCTGESWKTNAKKDIYLNPGSLLRSAQMYLGEVDPRTPLASPLYANLEGLPPILIQVGSDEILLSDATRLAERAKAAGVDVTLEVWEGMQHVWHFVARFAPEGRQAIDRIGRFIADHL